jgi:hypothetical protein
VEPQDPKLNALEAAREAARARSLDELSFRPVRRRRRRLLDMRFLVGFAIGLALAGYLDGSITIGGDCIEFAPECESQVPLTLTGGAR